MKTLILFLIVLSGYAKLSAQDSIVTVKAGYKISDVLNPNDIFYYPQFTNARIFFRDGSKTVAKINYNHLTDQMLFINYKGDTLALADEKNINMIVIDQDTFYFDDGYLKLIADNDIIKVAEKKSWVVADVRKVGAFNTTTNTVGITSLSNYTDEHGRAKSYDLLANEDVILKKESQYYFGNQYNNFNLAGKKKLFLLFPKDHLILENYLKENKVNFENKDDLKKIAQFLAQNK